MLSDEPHDIDTITEELSLQPKIANTVLLGLEMKGMAKQLPGKLYVKGPFAKSVQGR
jgi:predicted Rossmann fold nucleotide-binding protein DprA/Smf involved in DNA uptake